MAGFSTKKEQGYLEAMEAHLQKFGREVPLSYLVNNFAVNARRQEVTRFLARHELFKKILDRKGAILECGVFAGNGLMSWAQLSAILEPMAFMRSIYGFDTFEGFPSVDSKDLEGSQDAAPKAGDLKDSCYESLLRSIELFDDNRLLNQFPMVSLVKGDFLETSEQFIADNPHLLIALLFLDFDLYQPTKKALEVFLPRMPKGSILAFDQINNPGCPGETTALLESVTLRDVEVQQFSFEPNIAYIVL